MEKRESLKMKPHLGGAIGGSCCCCLRSVFSFAPEEDEEGSVVVVVEEETNLFRAPIVVCSFGCRQW